MLELLWAAARTLADSMQQVAVGGAAKCQCSLKCSHGVAKPRPPLIRLVGETHANPPGTVAGDRKTGQ